MERAFNKAAGQMFKTFQELFKNWLEDSLKEHSSSPTFRPLEVQALNSLHTVKFTVWRPRGILGNLGRYEDSSLRSSLEHPSEPLLAAAIKTGSPYLAHFMLHFVLIFQLFEMQSIFQSIDELWRGWPFENRMPSRHCRLGGLVLKI